MAAIALFAGYYFSKKWAIILTLAIMFISDISLGFYDWKLMAVVYGCMALTVLVGAIIKKYQSGLVVLNSSLAISIIFFLVTNLAVWLFSSWYVHSWSGLMNCYVLALPFFRNNLLGNLFYSAVLFGSYEAVKLLARQKITVRI